MPTYSHIFSMFCVYATLCTDVNRISNLLLLYSLLPLPLPPPQVQEEWYESLRDCDAAYKAYQNKQYLRPDDMNLTLGRMRCLSAMCKWSDLYQLAEDSWGAVDDETRQKMSVMASAAAWGLGEWDRMKEYAGSIPKGTMDCSFYHALLNIHDKKFDKAQEVCVDIPSLLPLSFPPPSLLPSSLSFPPLLNLHFSSPSTHTPPLSLLPVYQ